MTCLRVPLLVRSECGIVCCLGPELDFSGESNLEANARNREHQECKLAISVKTGRSQCLTEKSGLHRVKLLMQRDTGSGLPELFVRGANVLY